MRNLLRVATFSLLLPCMAYARVDSFKVSIPPSWKELSDEPQYSIFENSKSPANLETIVAQKFARFSKDETYQSTLETHAAELTKLRGAMFRKMGLGNYTILEMRKRLQPKSEFGFYQEIHSRYLSFDGRETQMLERQYATRDALYVVSYVVRASALNDRARADRLLDLVQPQKSHRRPASETVESKTAVAAASGEVSDVAPPKEPRALDMNSAEAKALCLNVDEKVRRQPGEGPGFDSLSQQFYKFRGCATGVVQSLWGLVTGAASVLAWVDNVTSSGESSARDQLYATAGTVIKEIKQDGVTNFAWKIGMGMYEAVSKEVSDFPCLSNEEQMRKVCAILGGAIPPGILVKLALRTALTAKQMAELSAAIRKGFGTEGKAPHLTKVPDAVAQKTEPVGRFADGTLTREQALKQAQAEPMAQRVEAVKRVNDDFARYEKIKKAYGDLLPDNKAELAKIYELIAKAEARGVKKEKIRDTLRIEGARCTR